MLPYALWRDGRDVIPAMRRYWRRGLAGGALAGLVLWHRAVGDDAGADRHRRHACAKPACCSAPSSRWSCSRSRCAPTRIGAALLIVCGLVLIRDSVIRAPIRKYLLEPRKIGLGSRDPRVRARSADLRPSEAIRRAGFLQHRAVPQAMPEKSSGKRRARRSAHSRRPRQGSARRRCREGPRGGPQMIPRQSRTIAANHQHGTRSQRWRQHADAEIAVRLLLKRRLGRAPLGSETRRGGIGRTPQRHRADVGGSAVTAARSVNRLLQHRRRVRADRRDQPRLGEAGNRRLGHDGDRDGLALGMAILPRQWPGRRRRNKASRSRHISSTVRSVPCLRQRRAEVVTRARRARGRPRRLSLADSATSSISAIAGKPPAARTPRA